MRINYTPPGLPPQAQNQATKVEDQGFQSMLDKAKKDQDKEKLWDVSRQFESVFIYQMMKKMREAIPKSDLMGNSMGEEIFQGMLDEKLSEEMSKAGGIGLAQMVYEQLSRSK
ncbi:MAG: rod-binding protein [Thermincolia bacterium]